MEKKKMIFAVCNSCGKEIEEYGDICPFCGSMLFLEAIKTTIPKSEEDKSMSIIRKWGIETRTEFFSEKFEVVTVREQIKSVFEKSKKWLVNYKFSVMACGIIIMIIFSMWIGGSLFQKKSNRIFGTISFNMSISDIKKLEGYDCKTAIDLDDKNMVIYYENRMKHGIKGTMYYYFEKESDPVEKAIFKFKSSKTNRIKMKRYLDGTYGKGRAGISIYRGKYNGLIYEYTNGNIYKGEMEKVVFYSKK